MPDVRRTDIDESDSSATGWIVAIVLLVILIGLVFFAFQLHWFGLGVPPQTNINIQQPSGGGSGTTKVKPPAPSVPATQSQPTSP